MQETAQEWRNTTTCFPILCYPDELTGTGNIDIDLCSLHSSQNRLWMEKIKVLHTIKKARKCHHHNNNTHKTSQYLPSTSYPLILTLLSNIGQKRRSFTPTWFHRAVFLNHRQYPNRWPNCHNDVCQHEARHRKNKEDAGWGREVWILFDGQGSKDQVLHDLNAVVTFNHLLHPPSLLPCIWTKSVQHPHRHL